MRDKDTKKEVEIITGKVKNNFTNEPVEYKFFVFCF